MDEVRSIRYQIQADAEGFALELIQAQKKLDAFERKMRTLGGASREDVAAARDALAQQKVWAQEGVQWLEKRKRLHDVLFRDTVKRRVEEEKRALQQEEQLFLKTQERKRRVLEYLLQRQLRTHAKNFDALKAQEAQVKQLANQFNNATSAVDKLAKEEAKLLAQFSKAKTLGERNDIGKKVDAVRVAKKKAELLAIEALEKASNAETVRNTLAAATAKSKIDAEAANRRVRTFHEASRREKAEMDRRHRERLQGVRDTVDTEERLSKEMVAQQIAGMQKIGRDADFLRNKILNHWNDIEKAANRTANAVRAFGQGMQAVGGTLSRIGIGLSAAITAPTVLLAKQATEFNTLRENALNAFTAIIGSAEKAQGVFAKLYEFAKPTAFGFENVVASAAKLVNSGIAVERSIPILERVAKLTAIAQVSGKDPGTAIKQVTDIIGRLERRGNLTKTYLNQLSNILNFQDALLQKMGKENATVKEREALYKAIEKRQISSAFMLETIFETIDRLGNGLLEQQRNSFAGLMANLEDSWTIFLADFLTPVFNYSKGVLKVAIEYVELLGDKMRALSDRTKFWLAATVAVVAAAGPLLIIFGQITSGLGTALAALALFKITLLAKLGPAALEKGMFAAIGGGIQKGFAAGLNWLSAFIGQFWAAFAGIPALFSSVWAWFVSAAAGAWAAVGALFSSVANAGFIGTLLAGLSTVVQGLSSAAAGAVAFGTAVASGALAAAVAFAKIAIPIFLLVSIIGGVVRAITTYWEDIKAGFVAAWGFVVSFYKSDVEGPLKAVTQSIFKFFYGIYDEIANFVTDAFGQVVDWVKVNWPLIKDAIANTMYAAIGVIALGIAGIYELWKLFGPTIIAIVEPAWGLIKDLFKTALGAILDVIQIVLAVIAGDWDKFWEGLGSLTSRGFQLLHAIIRRGFEFSLSFFEKFGEMAWNISFGLYNRLIEGAGNALKNLVSTVRSYEGGIWQAFRDLANRAWQGFKAGILGSQQTDPIALGFQAPNLVPNDPIVQAERERNLKIIEEKKQAGADAADSFFQQWKATLGGLTGFEGSETPDIDWDAADKKSKKGRESRESVDRAEIAISKLATSVKKLNRELGLGADGPLLAFYQELSKISREGSRIKSLTSVTDQSDKSVQRWLSRESQNYIKARQAFEEKVFNTILYQGPGELSRQMEAIHDDTLQKEREFQEKFVEIHKVGSAKRLQAEYEFAQYRDLLLQEEVLKQTEVYKKAAEETRAFQRKIVDIQYENVEAEGRRRRLEMNRDLRDEKERLVAFFGNDTYIARAAWETKFDEFRRAKHASFARWYREQERDLMREVQQMRAAAYGGSDLSDLISAQIEAEDKARQIRSKLDTGADMSPERRAEMERLIVEVQGLVWAKFHRKRMEDEREWQRQRRDARIDNIYDPLLRQAEEAKRIFDDTFREQLEIYGGTVDGVTLAWVRAKQAADDFKETQRQILENALRAALNDADPLAKYDAKKQEEFNRAIEQAVPIMIQLGISVEYLQQVLGGAAFNAENLAKALGKIQEAKGSDKGIKRMTKGIQELRREAREAIEDIFSFTNVATKLFNAVGDAFYNAASGAQSLGEALKSSLLGALAEIASAAGEVFIGWGVAELAAGNFAKGAALIAAGLALKALAGFLAGKAKSSASTAAGDSVGAAQSTGAASQSFGQDRDRQGRPTDLNTRGEQVIRIKFDTGNMNRGMRQAFQGVKAEVEREITRRSRGRFVEAR